MRLLKDRVFLLFFSLISITASMDIFLVWRVGGFTLRSAVLLMVVVIAWWLLHILRKREVFLVPGIGWLVLLASANTVFAFNSVLLVRSLSYAVWLWIFVLWVMVVTEMSHSETKKDESAFERLLVVYMLSFLPALFIGWLQWAIPSLAWLRDGLWRTQWGLPIFGEYSLYRVNGWNYEPSYYATYLIVLPPLLWAWWKQTSGKMRRVVGVYFVFVLMMIGLSTSRMGWIALLGEMVGIGLLEIGGKLKHLWQKTSFRKQLLLFVLGGGILFTIVAGIFLPWQKALEKILSHSYTERMEGIQNTFEVFFRHPILSVSLGGVAPDITVFRGQIVPQGNHDVKPFEALSVLVEFFGGLGIVGGFLFAGLCASIFLLTLSRWKKLSSSQRIWFIALAFGMAFQLFLLLFNQNLLRVYVWNHIAMVFGFLAWTEGSQKVSSSFFLPFNIQRGFVALFAFVFTATLAILVFVFQPLFVQPKGGSIHVDASVPVIGTVVWYNTGRWFSGYEGVRVRREGEGEYFDFSDNMAFSKRFFNENETTYVWKNFTNLLAQTNLPSYIGVPLTNLYHVLENQKKEFVRTPGGFVAGLNWLLEDGTFLDQQENMIRLSPLTHQLKKKKNTKDFDVIRYRRLLLEDLCVWVPRNPEGHSLSLWLFEWQVPLAYSNRNLHEAIKTKALEISTTLGKVMISPWDTSPQVEEEKKYFMVKTWFDWSRNRWYIQAQFFRLWWTLMTVGIAIGAALLAWWLSGKSWRKEG